jgi:hypothetical protein
MEKIPNRCGKFAVNDGKEMPREEKQSETEKEEIFNRKR